MCVSVKQHCTSGASVHPESTKYSVGKEGQKICTIFSETNAFQILSAPSFGGPYIGQPIFPAENTHAHFMQTPWLNDDVTALVF